ncbi:M16 family metallopeptidase [Argonema galeatum]|uniref:M16 family metallopeptidase n=1 Tax=Argonema galeatum TaxID=2942762 RepID=UPI0020121E2B|nr:pitrilysin family protein [Argonema galeatum]MCL1464885.1 insulinase family protein [Argonema galeatum A003/A1]
MSFLTTCWRRYRIPALLFSLCLSYVVLFSGETANIQPAAATMPKIEEAIALSQSSAVTPADETSLSLTQNVRKTVLENGLTVLTKEVHTAPVVTVQAWYKVGSRNEEPGVNGIAHQLEHMMFKGTTNRPIQFGRLFSALGSNSNAFTSYDETAYFGTVERDKLPAMLVLEADRMENAFIGADQLASEKRVVISELQGYENSPEYRLDRAVMRAVFPNLPYGLTVGGTKADVEKFTVEQVQRYYNNYYSPNNATLIIVGDFQTEPTLKAVREIFGKLPNRAGERESGRAGENVPSNAPTPHSSTPIVLREAGSAPLLKVVYPLPPTNHPDVAALKVMDYILTGGRSSRIYQALVESGLASDAGGYAANLIGGGWYQLSATAVRDRKVTEIDRVLGETIADLQNKSVTEEELNRAKAQFRAAVILGNREITAQAMQLGDDYISTGDYSYTDKLLKEVQGVSAADVQRVAKEYLKESDRTVGYFEPTQLTDQGGATTSNNSQTTEHFNLGPPVDPAEVAKYLPNFTSSGISTTQSLPESFKLSNGLQVLLLSDRSTPTITLSGYIQAGTEFDLLASAGIASLTAENLLNGTKTKDALTLAKTLEERGASLSFAATREGVSFDGYSLSKDLPTLVQTLADVLQNANFPEDQLELSRQRSLTQLKERFDNPSYLAYRTLQQTIYPSKHPFHVYPTNDSLKRITDADVMRFYQAHYRPDTTVLTVVGDFEAQKVRSLIETQLGSWKASGKAPRLDFPSVPMPEKVVRLNPVIPGKSQAITFMGYRGINRQDPRYYATLVLNEILGGDTLSSRLGNEIRDRLGLTYGIYSAFQAGKEPGLFLINMQTAPEDTNKAIASTLGLLQQVHAQGVSSAEVDTAKRSLISSYTVQLADPDSLTSVILMNEVYGLSLAEIRDFTRKIQAVSLEQVNQIAKDLLQPDNLVVVTAGPSVSPAALR